MQPAEPHIGTVWGIACNDCMMVHDTVSSGVHVAVSDCLVQCLSGYLVMYVLVSWCGV